MGRILARDGCAAGRRGSNLATKQDLLELEARMVEKLNAYTLRTILVANLTMAAAFAGIALTAARIGA